MIAGSAFVYGPGCGAVIPDNESGKSSEWDRFVLIRYGSALSGGIVPSNTQNHSQTKLIKDWALSSKCPELTFFDEALSNSKECRVVYFGSLGFRTPNERTREK